MKFLVTLLVVACFGVFPVDRIEGGDLTPGETSLKSVFPELEVVRCLFAEGRLVVRHQSELKILHSGDRWPEAGLKVLQADEDGIVIVTMESEVLPSGQAVPKAMVILSRGPEGQVSIRTFASEAPKRATIFEAPKGSSVPGSGPLKIGGSGSSVTEAPSSGAPTEIRHAE